MNAEKRQLLALIDDYNIAVANAVFLLNAKSEREKGFQTHQESAGYYAGYLDEGKHIRYAFHGIGCLVTSPAFTVDLDFGEEGRCDSIDVYFLFNFLTSNRTIKENYPLLTSSTQVEQLMLGLEQERFLIKNSAGTYYLRSDARSANPPTLKLYGADESNS